MAAKTQRKEVEENLREIAARVLKAMLKLKPSDFFDASGKYKRVADIDPDVLLALRNPTVDPRTGRLLSVHFHDKLAVIDMINKMFPVEPEQPGVAAASAKAEEEVAEAAVQKVAKFLDRKKATKGNGKEALSH